MFERREEMTTADLYESLQEGLSAAMALIESPNFDPNYRDNDGDSILYAACCWGSPAVVQALLSAGADPSVAGPSGSPLYIAAGLGDVTIVEMLLDHGARVDVGGPGTGGYRATPLNAAIRYRQFEVARLLVDRGASPNIACNAERETPLMGAAFLGESDLVLQLIRAGAYVDQKDGSGDTALTYFALGGSCKTEIAVALLQNGGDIDDLYSHGCVFVKYDPSGRMIALSREQVRIAALDDKGLCIATLSPEMPLYRNLCY